MNRTGRNRLLLFVALFHLLSDVAFAGGAILCVGPNDHRAIESEHLAEAGCQTTSAASSSSLALTEGAAAEDCTDSPLHSEAEFVSSADQNPDVQPTAAASVLPSCPSLAAIDTVRPRARAPDESSSLRAHRTIVLVI